MNHFYQQRGYVIDKYLNTMVEKPTLHKLDLLRKVSVLCFSVHLNTRNLEENEYPAPLR